MSLSRLLFVTLIAFATLLGAALVGAPNARAQAQSVPTNLTATLGDNRIFLDFDAFLGGASTFHIERSVRSNQNGFTFPFAEIGRNSTTSFVDDNILPNATYFYRVRRFIPGVGFSDYSNVAEVTFPFNPSDS